MQRNVTLDALASDVPKMWLLCLLEGVVSMGGRDATLDAVWAHSN